MNRFVTDLVTKTGDIGLAASAWRLELLDPIVAPQVAQQALARGHESDAVVLLAGELRPTRRDQGELINRAFAELLGELPSDEESVVQVCDAVAVALVRADDAEVLRLLGQSTNLMVKLSGQLGLNNLLYLLDHLNDMMEYDPPHRLGVPSAINQAREQAQNWLQREHV